MSWNPRRFAEMAQSRYIAGGKPPILLWLTADAQERIASAVRNGIIDYTDDPLDRTDVVVGLATPVPMTVGNASVVVGFAGDAAVCREKLLRRAQLLPPHLGEQLTDMALRLDMSDTPESAVGVINRRGAVFGCGGFDRTTWAETGSCSKNELVEFAEGVGLTAASPLDGQECQQAVDLLRAAWTLLNEPIEAEVTATNVFHDLVTLGKKRKAHQQAVSVIDIRRRSSVGPRDGGREPIEHDHRWTVRGHWRRQPFGPGRSQRRRIWIEEHVAGPDDKPLVNRPKVKVIR